MRGCLSGCVCLEWCVPICGCYTVEERQGVMYLAGWRPDVPMDSAYHCWAQDCPSSPHCIPTLHPLASLVHAPLVGRKVCPGLHGPTSESEARGVWAQEEAPQLVLNGSHCVGGCYCRAKLCLGWRLRGRPHPCDHTLPWHPGNLTPCAAGLSPGPSFHTHTGGCPCQS